MLTQTRNRGGTRCAALWVAAAALIGAVALTGCDALNDNPAGGTKMIVSFEGQLGNSATNGAITTPSNSETVKSLIVGAIVITHTTDPYTDADQVDETARENIKDDAIQSAAYLTIEDLPYSGTSISFLIPPGASDNWQLVGVGTRDNIDVLQDLEDLPDSPIWYGFTPYFAGGPSASSANKIKPGDTVTLTLGPGCNLDVPPQPPCP